MKFINTVFIAGLLTMLTSCAVRPSVFYQVYKTQNTTPIVKKDNKLSYEDDNCKVTYDFWKKGGDPGFTIYNKSDQDIFLNLEASFLIFNGIANNYYRDRVTTYSFNAGATSTKNAQKSKSITGLNYFNQLQTNSVSVINSIESTASLGESVSYNEERIICIPPKTSKIIREYELNQSLFRDPDLFKYPSRKQIRSKKFAITNSPFVFSNRLSYKVGEAGSPIKFENGFFVSEITNYPEREITEIFYEEFAGQKSLTPTRKLKNPAPDKFFMMYYNLGDHWKH